MVDSPKSEENTESLSDSRDRYGFNHYPERRRTEQDTFWNAFWHPKVYNYRKVQCEQKVLNALKNPLVKLLIEALKSAGCPVNIQRNIVCEECSKAVTGGYDTELNQIVICHNSWKARNHPEVTLTHELIHMFDNCVGEVDFRNPEHLACTEIRAANLAHCSFTSSLLLGQSSFINIKNTHQYCVKLKAAQSMMLARNMDFPTAMDTILKVFDKCYNDLEPIGRRIRRHSLDPSMAYNEGKSFGYCSS